MRQKCKSPQVSKGGTLKLSFQSMAIGRARSSQNRSCKWALSYKNASKRGTCFSWGVFPILQDRPIKIAKTLEQARSIAYIENHGLQDRAKKVRKPRNKLAESAVEIVKNSAQVLRFFYDR